MARFIIKALLFALFGVLVHRVLRLAIIMGVHRHPFNHTPGPCRIVPGIDFGSEDITTLSNGIAFISSGIAMNQDEWESIPRHIYTFDFNQPDKNVEEVKIKGVSFNNINPLGMSVWEDAKTDKVTVFLVNRGGHGQVKPSIELFDYDQKSNTLHHKKKVTSDNIYSPNDIVAESADAFYVSNDIRYGGLEIFLTLSKGTVAYYDGSKAELVADNVAMSNGINRSPDGRYIYVAGLFDAHIHVFERGTDGSLRLRKKIDMHTSVDNINVDSSGDLWMGCHYQLYKLDLVGGNRETGPAQVLKLHFDSDLNPDVREVLSDDGQLLRGSSVASVYGNKMLVGTVTNKMLYCDLLAY